MISIEKEEYPMDIDITYKKRCLQIQKYTYPLGGTISLTERCILSMKTKGGVIADEMGLGKTLTSLAIIGQNPSFYNDLLKENRIYSKATAIICPSHLVKQWESEIHKMYKNFNIIKILTKTQHKEISYNDIRNADIIIISQQFLCNFKYYPTVKYDNHRFNTVGMLKTFYYFNRRLQHLLSQNPLLGLQNSENTTSFKTEITSL